MRLFLVEETRAIRVKAENPTEALFIAKGKFELPTNLASQGDVPRYEVIIKTAEY